MPAAWALPTALDAAGSALLPGARWCALNRICRSEYTGVASTTRARLIRCAGAEAGPHSSDSRRTGM
eukprot:13268387-Alexandrium_andersonii.AAC.1